VTDTKTATVNDDLLVEQYKAATGKEELPLCYVDHLTETQTLSSLLLAVELEITTHGSDAVVAFDSGYSNISVSLAEASVIRSASAKMAEKRRKAEADDADRNHAKLKAQLLKLDPKDRKALLRGIGC
jgi:hypothetical protein